MYVCRSPPGFEPESLRGIARCATLTLRRRPFEKCIKNVQSFWHFRASIVITASQWKDKSFFLEFSFWFLHPGLLVKVSVFLRKCNMVLVCILRLRRNMLLAELCQGWIARATTPNKRHFTGPPGSSTPAGTGYLIHNSASVAVLPGNDLTRNDIFMCRLRNWCGQKVGKIQAFRREKWGNCSSGRILHINIS